MSVPEKSVKDGLGALRKARKYSFGRMRELAARVQGLTKQIDVRPKIDQKTKELVAYLHAVPEMPDDLAFIVADAIQTLRDGLDRLIYESATLSTGEERVMYPIYDSPEKFKNGFPGGLAKHLHKDVLTAIEATKPHKGGNEGLWLLNRLANIKKHRMSLGAAMTSGAASPYDALAAAIPNPTTPIEKALLESAKGLFLLPSEPTFVKVGGELRRYPPGSKPDLNSQFLLLLAFEEPADMRGEPVDEAMRQFYAAVDGVDAVFSKLP